MTQNEKQLWSRIEAFDIGDKEAPLSFARRLARDNRWSINYTQRVIEEYKKFIFLCCVSETPLTPSDPVDQAWHLHLTYTKSYWQDLCRDILGREIHHNPTKGGNTERQKFDNCYTSLQEIYFTKFQQYPPNDIWQDNEKRFSDINFQRVNLGDYWLVRKPSLPDVFKTGTAIFLASLLLGTTDYGLFIFIAIGCIIIAAIVKHKRGGESSGCSTSGGGCSSGCATSNDGSGDSGCSGCGGCGGD